jgi:hypothetical protein
MLAGESCGGAAACNSQVELPPIQNNTVKKALSRLDEGFLAFVGLTDEWNPSIGLFHSMLMPAIPVFDIEYQNMHSSLIEHEELNRTTAAKLAFERQEAAFAAIPIEARRVFAEDPDHIVFARAREIFCSNFKTFVADVECKSKSPFAAAMKTCLQAYVPHECSRSLGILPIPLDKPFQPYQQRKAARGLLERWHVTRETTTGSKLALILSGGPVSSEADPRNWATATRLRHSSESTVVINNKSFARTESEPVASISEAVAPKEAAVALASHLSAWFDKARREVAIASGNRTKAGKPAKISVVSAQNLGEIRSKAGANRLKANAELQL